MKLFDKSTMPQFNKEESLSGYVWYSMTYQSNKVVNGDHHAEVKQFIAELLIGTFKRELEIIHSYIHGEIIFLIRTKSPIQTFDRIVNVVKTPFSEYEPNHPLFFSLALVARSDGGLHMKHIMYIQGNSEMDEHFTNSIKKAFENR